MTNSEHDEGEPSLLEPLSLVPEQYDAGYLARYQGQPISVGATRSWQAGWTDASRELGVFEEIFAPPQVTLPCVGSGEQARHQGKPFDASLSEVWKRGWIETDIALGLLEHSTDS